MATIGNAIASDSNTQPKINGILHCKQHESTPDDNIKKLCKVQSVQSECMIQDVIILHYETWHVNEKNLGFSPFDIIQL